MFSLQMYIRHFISSAVWNSSNLLSWRPLVPIHILMEQSFRLGKKVRPLARGWSSWSTNLSREKFLRDEPGLTWCLWMVFRGIDFSCNFPSSELQCKWSFLADWFSTNPCLVPGSVVVGLGSCACKREKTRGLVACLASLSHSHHSPGEGEACLSPGKGGAGPPPAGWWRVGGWETCYHYCYHVVTVRMTRD